MTLYPPVVSLVINFVVEIYYMVTENYYIELGTSVQLETHTKQIPQNDMFYTHHTIREDYFYICNHQRCNNFCYDVIKIITHIQIK